MNAELLDRKVSDLSPEELESLAAEAKKKKKLQKERERKAYEEKRNLLVTSLVTVAKQQNEALQALHKMAYEELSDFYEVMKKQAHISEKNKGTFSIKSADGKLKVEFASNVVKAFDERAEAAAHYMHQFLEKMVKKKDVATYELVTGLLQKTGKNETFDPRLIGRLFQMEDNFDHEDWVKAIALFKEAYTESHTAVYIRFWEMDEKGKYHNINLNFASL